MAQENREQFRAPETVKNAYLTENLLEHRAKLGFKTLNGAVLTTILINLAYHPIDTALQAIKGLAGAVRFVPILQVVSESILNIFIMIALWRSKKPLKQKIIATAILGTAYSLIMAALVGMVVLGEFVAAPFLFTSAIAIYAGITSFRFIKMAIDYYKHPWKHSNLSSLRLANRGLQAAALIAITALIPVFFFVPGANLIVGGILIAAAASITVMSLIKSIRERAIIRNRLKTAIAKNENLYEKLEINEKAVFEQVQQENPNLNANHLHRLYIKELQQQVRSQYPVLVKQYTGDHQALTSIHQAYEVLKKRYAINLYEKALGIKALINKGEFDPYQKIGLKHTGFLKKSWLGKRIALLRVKSAQLHWIKLNPDLSDKEKNTQTSNIEAAYRILKDTHLRETYHILREHALLPDKIIIRNAYSKRKFFGTAKKKKGTEDYDNTHEVEKQPLLSNDEKKLQSQLSNDENEDTVFLNKKQLGSPRFFHEQALPLRKNQNMMHSTDEEENNNNNNTAH